MTQGLLLTGRDLRPRRLTWKTGVWSVYICCWQWFTYLTDLRRLFILCCICHFPFVFILQKILRRLSFFLSFFIKSAGNHPFNTRECQTPQHRPANTYFQLVLATPTDSGQWNSSPSGLEPWRLSQSSAGGFPFYHKECLTLHYQLTKTCNQLCLANSTDIYIKVWASTKKLVPTPWGKWYFFVRRFYTLY